MITKTNLGNIGVLSELKNNMVGDIEYDNWKIKKDPTNNYLFLEEKNKCLWFCDKTSFIEKFFDKLYNREFSSILCGGLGLGVVPYLVQSFCNKIDVIEIHQDNIFLIKNNTNYLQPHVNIIHDNFVTYNTTEKYDVILIDIWTCNLKLFYQQKDMLLTKYSENLNDGGIVYIPCIDHYKNARSLI